MTTDCLENLIRAAEDVLCERTGGEAEPETIARLIAAALALAETTQAEISAARRG